MNCTNCGNDNPDHARFCGHCGASLDPPASGRGRTVEVIDIDVPATGQPRVSAGLKWGILAVTLVLWPVGMAMGLF